MNSIIKEIEEGTLRKEKLSFNVGDSVKVHNLIREGEKERVQIYEGVVLKMNDPFLKSYDIQMLRGSEIICLQQFI